MSTGAVVFITGLPSSGKSTLAETVHFRLRERGVPCGLLDGDAVRKALVPEPGYSLEQREQFYRTLGNLAALLAGQGLVVLVAATANRETYRSFARAAAPRFFEIFVDVPIEECRSRDAKGLYAAQRSGAVSNVPGEDAPYERPSAPTVTARGGRDGAAIHAILELLKP